MKHHEASPPARPGRRPVAPLAIWIFEAIAITVLTLVMMVVKEFTRRPGAPSLAGKVQG